MSQYGLFPAIIMSFYSKSLYRDVAFNWGGKAYLYLLILIALSWIVLIIEIQMALNIWFDKNSANITPQIPVMTFKNGVLSTPENRPYIIKDPDSQTTIAVIDTSGKFTNLTDAQTKMLVLPTQVIMQSKPEETRVHKFPQTFNNVVDPLQVQAWLAKYLKFLWIPLFLLLWLGSYLYRLVQTLVYAIFGRLFSGITDSHLSYPQVVQVGLVSITPVIVLSTILDIFNIVIPYQLLLYIILALSYLFFGVYANKPALPMKKHDVIISEPPKDRL